MRVYRVTPEIEAVAALLKERMPNPATNYSQICAELNAQGWRLQDNDGEPIRIVLDVCEMLWAMNLAWDVQVHPLSADESLSVDWETEG